MNNGSSCPRLEINYGIPHHSLIDDFDDDFDRFHAWRFLLDLETINRSLWVMFTIRRAITVDGTRNTYTTAISNIRVMRQLTISVIL